MAFIGNHQRRKVVVIDAGKRNKGRLLTMNEAKKEYKFFALVIPAKDQLGFFSLKPEAEPLLDNIGTAYAQYRQSTGRKPYNKYIICNQDEPYAEEVWKVILAGEDAKRDGTQE